MSTLKPVRRRLAAVSAPVLLALSLTACGGDDAGGAPEDASVEEFCTTFTETPDEFDSDDNGAAVDAANEYADNLLEVGTPADFTEDARAGFEAYVGFLAEVDENDVEELVDSEGPEDIFSEEDAAAITTFLTEAGTACAGALGDLEVPEAEVPESPAPS